MILVEKIVYEQYPITEKEKGCRMEHDKRQWLRNELRKKLERENNISANKQEIGKHVDESLA